jgi:hypothetical protein
MAAENPLFSVVEEVHKNGPFQWILAAGVALGMVFAAYTRYVKILADHEKAEKEAKKAGKKA